MVDMKDVDLQWSEAAVTSGRRNELLIDTSVVPNAQGTYGNLGNQSIGRGNPPVQQVRTRPDGCDRNNVDGSIRTNQLKPIN
eukprot:8651240-Pyramimonas_sp.AAC.1